MSLLCYNFDAKLPYTCIKIQGENITKDTKLQTSYKLNFAL